MTPQQITDFLVSNPPAETLDTFPLYRNYSQLQSRYYTIKDFIRFDQQILPELDLLAALYVGFNGKDLSQERLSEINEKLSKFPASSLSSKNKNPSLNKLRKKLTAGHIAP